MEYTFKETSKDTLTEPCRERFSDASTSPDFDFYDYLNQEGFEDKEFTETSFPLCCLKNMCEISIPDLNKSWDLFEGSMTEQKSKYSTLNTKLENLLTQLESEIDNVNIRDECCIQPNPVELGSPCSSLLRRRRVTLPTKLSC